MVEAGTGVGKSFAYLVPAIQAAAEMKKKVVVSTHTIHLQEQLLNKDLPFLRSVLPHEFSAVLVKGRSNYISLRRLQSAVARADATFTRREDFDHLAKIQLWANRTDDGSRSDLDFTPGPAVWDVVHSDHGNCLGKQCKTYSRCHYFQARRRIWSANLLIVNHALFMADLAVRDAGGSLLPNYDLAIFDEAHTLEGVAAEHLGLRVSNSQVDYHLTRLYNERTQKGLLIYYRLADAVRQLQTTRTAAEDFFARVVEWQGAHGTANGRLRRKLPLADTLGEELRRLATVIGRGAEEIEAEEERIEVLAARDRCEAMAGDLQCWLSQEEAASVHWIELDNGPRRRVTLASAPLDVGPALRSLLFDRVPTCVLTSATLAVGAPPASRS